MDAVANMLDYIQWRGDLGFLQSGINVVDSLILSCLSYVGFDGIAGADSEAPISLREAAERYFAQPQERRHLRTPEDEDLLRAAAGCRRFQNILLTRYVNHVDGDAQTQFAAITIYLEDGTTFVSFRGTDNTLVGWKEDFNMSFLTPVPAQRCAVAYLEQVGPVEKLYIGGHSKGGNLAVFAATYCCSEIQACIQAVYNHDGPGFDARVLTSGGYLAVRDRTHTFVPQSSVVGMLLEHEENYTVVHSVQRGFMQHDPYSWEVLGTDFVRLDTVTNGSRFMDRSLNAWAKEMDVSQREQLFDILYRVLMATNAEKVTELSEGWLKNAVVILRSFNNIDEESRQFVFRMLSLLLQSARDNVSLFLPKPPVSTPHNEGKKKRPRAAGKKQTRSKKG